MTVCESEAGNVEDSGTAAHGGLALGGITEICPSGTC